MKFSDFFEHVFKPPGGGIYEVSAGKGSALELQRKHYAAVLGKTSPFTFDEVVALWRQSLRMLFRAKVALIGVPSDTGAGIRKGAAYGPRGVRFELLKLPGYRKLLLKQDVVDLGDLLCNPHLLHDEMLSNAQIQSSRAEMYPAASQEIQNQLAVSPLSQLKQGLSLLLSEFPQLKIFVIGGDHSVAWPVAEVLNQLHSGEWGIVQPDAHTDLLPSRLGVKYCFGTWSLHAAKLLHSAGAHSGKLVQLGIRQTAHDRGHWESTKGVRQFWPDEIKKLGSKKVAKEIVAHLKERGVRKIYFSNDIDGTDERYAPATGTPATRGLSPEFLIEVIDQLGRNFSVVAADVVEVAPPLGPTPAAAKKTCTVAAKFALASILAQLRNKS